MLTLSKAILSRRWSHRHSDDRPATPIIVLATSLNRGNLCLPFVQQTCED
jgi:hypothetical protein